MFNICIPRIYAPLGRRVCQSDTNILTLREIERVREAAPDVRRHLRETCEVEIANEQGERIKVKLRKTIVETDTNEMTAFWVYDGPIVLACRLP